MDDYIGETCSSLMHEGDEECIHTILVGRPQEKKPLERPSSRWELNTKVDVKETGFERWTLLR